MPAKAEETDTEEVPDLAEEIGTEVGGEPASPLLFSSCDEPPAATQRPDFKTFVKDAMKNPKLEQPPRRAYRNREGSKQLSKELQPIVGVSLRVCVPAAKFLLGVGQSRLDRVLRLH